MRSAALSLSFGPFVACLRTALPSVVDGWRLLYPYQLSLNAPDFIDFDVELAAARRWWRPTVRFLIDGESLFLPLPSDQALSICEWGLNMCVSSRAHQYLIFHAAVVERGGHAAILPGAPQSGKSTLTTALVHRGWRLLSDELTMLSFDTGEVVPLARPIHLKNRSIDVIRGFAPDATISPEVHGTLKGTVALVRAPEESVRRMHEPARPRWIIFPQWRESGDVALGEVKKAGAFLHLARNGISYSVHGRRGFTATFDLVEACDCLSFRYTRLEDAIAAFDELAAKP
jgi:HprK-related kinase A